MLNPDFKKVCEYIDKLDLNTLGPIRLSGVMLAIHETINETTHEKLKVATLVEESYLVEVIAFKWYVDECGMEVI